VIVLVALLTAAVGFVTGRYARLASREQQRWLRRAEALSLLRWAVDLALDADERRARTGVAAINGLRRSPLPAREDVAPLVTLGEQVSVFGNGRDRG
jgi:hypothetical protein